MEDWAEKYKVSVPEGESNDWKIERFTVSEDDETLERLRAMMHRTRRYARAGNYTRLMRRFDVIMSDTHDEIRDHFEVIHRAHGNCLINGLGLGMVLQAIARKPEVERVTVIELSSDVISLAAPHYRAMFGNKIEIIQADAYEYKPERGSHFGVVWHDIWDFICEDNLEGMKRLHRKYGRLTDWQGSWERDAIKHGVY